MSSTSRRLALAAAFLVSAGALSIPSAADAAPRHRHDHVSKPFHRYVYRHHQVVEPEFYAVQRLKRRTPRVAVVPAAPAATDPVPMTAILDVNPDKMGDCTERCPSVVADAVTPVSR